MTATTAAPAPAKSRPRPAYRGGPGVILALATLGFGLNFWAWGLLGPLGPHLTAEYGLDPDAHALLLALPLAVGSLARFPVGILTDRFGARVMFPAVSLATAVPVIGLAFANSVLLLVAAGCAAGVGGAAFAVGAPLVSRWYPYGRRGFALGVFGTGAAGAGAGQLSSAWVGAGGQRPLTLLLGGLLIGYAGLAALTIRDVALVRGRAGMLASGLEVLRARSMASLSLLYAVAFGGLLAFSLYLPTYLRTAYHVGAGASLRWTAAFVGLAAAARLVGGVLTDRRNPIRVLVVCHLAAGFFLVLQAVEPRMLPGAALAIGGFGIAVGAASGALLALICKASPADRVGAATGVVGAVGGLGALLPPLLLATVYQLAHSYELGLVLLAGALVAVALHLRRNAPAEGLGLVLPTTVPAEQPPQTTVVTLTGPDVGSGGAAVAAILAELAARDELVVVLGRPERGDGLSPHALVTELRARLPRHRVVAVLVEAGHPVPGVVPGTEVEFLADLLQAGAVPVAVTIAANPNWAAVELAQRLDADRVLQANYDPRHGAQWHEVWARRADLSRT